MAWYEEECACACGEEWHYKTIYVEGPMPYVPPPEPGSLGSILQQVYKDTIVKQLEAESIALKRLDRQLGLDK